MAERWIEQVLDVEHVSEILMVVRGIVWRTVLNVISAYAPRAERCMVEEEEWVIF